MKDKLKRASCSDCADYCVPRDPQSKKLRGVVLHSGYRYCLHSRRPRHFKRPDPKYSVPKWCPKRLKISILRVYGFKDSTAEYLSLIFGQNVLLPSRYRLRHSAQTHINPKDLLNKYLPRVDNVHISTGEVIEIDDGIRPVFFVCRADGLKLTTFNKTQISLEESDHV